MSEAAAAEKPAAPAGGGNKMLLLIVLVVNVLIAGGLGFVVFTNQKNAAAAAAAAAKHEGGEEGHEAAEGEAAEGEGAAEEGHAKKPGANGKFGPLVDIGTFVANLTSQAGPSRYAKVALHVEATNEDAQKKLEAAVVPVKNEALLYLSGLQAEQVVGQDKIRLIQDELQKRMEAVVGKKVVKHVYFSEFVVQ
jgi:flagellar basal body-associated protein FliL